MPRRIQPITQPFGLCGFATSIYAFKHDECTSSYRLHGSMTKWRGNLQDHANLIEAQVRSKDEQDLLFGAETAGRRKERSIVRSPCGVGNS